MNWFGGSIPEAVAEAKRNNKLFLVYIEGTDEMSKEMTSTYNDPVVAEKLSSPNVIALKLVANSVPYQQFCAIYPVLVIPSSFFIGGNGAPIEIITGSLPPADFSTRIDKLLQGCVKPKSSRIDLSGISMSSTEATPSTSQNVDPGPSSLENVDSTLSQPSTSQVAEAAEPTVSLEEKLERAKVLVEAQRQSKALEEQEEEKKRELDRRNVGKALQEAEKTKHDNELKEWAKSRAKEKEEERVARERVKAMIAQDRAERAAKYKQTKDAEEAERESARAQEDGRDEEVVSNEARIQFRLSNGSFKNKIFHADDTLGDARRFVVQEVVPPYPQFAMCTTYPRRHFAESDFPETLRNLGLSPSAVILIVPAHAVAVSEEPGFFSSLFWMLLLPVTSVWNYISSFFRTPQTPQGPVTAQNPRVPQPPPANASPRSRSPNPPQREAPFARREGNVFRIHNQSDDDENNTWNGNSTQQM